ncbi:MAG TPA: hypothetical protein VGE63_02365 [Candidatus Paceibacterota bacterium]
MEIQALITLARVISVVVSIGVVWGFGAALLRTSKSPQQEHPQKPKHWVAVKASGALFIAGLVVAGAYCIFSFKFVVNPIMEGDSIIILGFGALYTVFAILLILYLLNYKILCTDQKIIKTGVFGNKKEVLWQDIQQMNFNTHSSLLTINAHKKVLQINLVSDNAKKIIDCIRKYVDKEIWEEAVARYYFSNGMKNALIQTTEQKQGEVYVQRGIGLFVPNFALLIVLGFYVFMKYYVHNTEPIVDVFGRLCGGLSLIWLVMDYIITPYGIGITPESIIFYHFPFSKSVPLNRCQYYSIKEVYSGFFFKGIRKYQTYVCIFSLTLYDSQRKVLAKRFMHTLDTNQAPATANFSIIKHKMATTNLELIR